MQKRREKMNEQEKIIAKKIFSAYYKNTDFSIPDIEKREFGIGFEKKIDARHLSFENELQLKNYLIENPPFFISFSAAHYEKPSMTPIEKKGWLGADLVFDLDYHSEGKYDAYKSLGKVKEDLIRLSEDFLQDDFGISKNEIVYVFSGNRGYHIHVRSNDTFLLGSHERREIVDYIRGVGLDTKKFFSTDERGRIIGPAITDSGYSGRFVKKFIFELLKSPSRFYRGFADKKKLDSFIEGINSDNNWSRTPFDIQKLYSKGLIKEVSDALPISCVDADAGVTYDIKKLIRMPNSLHGETGFIAKEIKDIESFEPMKDSLIKTKKMISIKFTENLSNFEIGNSTYSFESGKIEELLLPIGLFFVLKGSATINVKFAKNPSTLVLR